MQTQQAELKMANLIQNQLKQGTDGTGVNTSGLEPLGHAVLIRTYEPEIKSSMIHIPEAIAGRMAMVEQRCIVIAVGPEAWRDEAAPRCKPGDKALVTKFAGYVTNQTADGQSYRLVNDRDLFCRITWE